MLNLIENRTIIHSFKYFSNLLYDILCRSMGCTLHFWKGCASGSLFEMMNLKQAYIILHIIIHNRKFVEFFRELHFTHTILANR